MSEKVRSLRLLLLCDSRASAYRRCQQVLVMYYEGKSTWAESMLYLGCWWAMLAFAPTVGFYVYVGFPVFASGSRI